MERITVDEAIELCKQGKECYLCNEKFDDVKLIGWEDGYFKDEFETYTNPYKDLIDGDFFCIKKVA